MTKKTDIDLPFDNRYLYALIFPIVVELLLNLTIGMADTMMVSSCGEESISGVSLVDSVANLLIYVFKAFATGGAVVCSQYLGAGKKHEASRSAKQLLYISFIVSFIFSSCLLIFRRPIMSGVFGDIGPGVLLSSLRYLVPLAPSFIFLALTDSLNAIARSMGETRITMKVSLVMNIINIGGNAFFIFALGLGPFGAGLGSLISRIASFSIMFHWLRKHDGDISIKGIMHLEWVPSLQKRILRVALPNGIESGLFNLGKILVASVVASFGTASMAANAVMNSLAGVAIVVGSAIGMASITVIGQCCGAGNYDAAKYYMKKLMLFTFIGMAITQALLYIALPFLLTLFNLTSEAHAIIKGMLGPFVVNYLLFWGIAFTMPNFLRAAGDVKYTMIVSVASMWTFRIAFAYLLGIRFDMGVSGVWWAMYLDWYCRCIFFLFRIKSGRWMEKKVI